MKNLKKCVFCKSCISKYENLMCTDARINKGIVKASHSCKYFIRDKGG